MKMNTEVRIQEPEDRKPEAGDRKLICNIQDSFVLICFR